MTEKNIENFGPFENVEEILHQPTHHRTPSSLLYFFNRLLILTLALGASCATMQAKPHVYEKYEDFTKDGTINERRTPRIRAEINGQTLTVHAEEIVEVTGSFTRMRKARKFKTEGINPWLLGLDWASVGLGVFVGVRIIQSGQEKKEELGIKECPDEDEPGVDPEVVDACTTAKFGGGVILMSIGLAALNGYTTYRYFKEDEEVEKPREESLGSGSSVYPPVIQSLSGKPVKLIVGYREIELGTTDARGNLNVSLPNVISCENIGHSEGEPIKVKVGENDILPELPFEKVAALLMTEREKEFFRRHLIARETGVSISPSLRYMAEAHGGCMTGVVRKAIDERVREVFQGSAMVDEETVQLPAGICDGNNTLKKNDKVFFRRGIDRLIIATTTGTCEGTVLPFRSTVLECFGPKEEAENMRKLKELASRGERGVDLVVLLQRFKSGYYEKLFTQDPLDPGTEITLLAINGFLQKYPQSCFRKEVATLLKEYLERKGYVYMELKRDTHIIPSLKYPDAKNTFFQGKKVFIRRHDQDPHFDIMRTPVDQLFGRRQRLWYVTAPDGSGGYATNFDLFGVYEEDPSFWKSHIQDIGQALGEFYVGLKEVEQAFGIQTSGVVSIPSPLEAARSGWEEGVKRGEQERCRKTCEYEYGVCLKCSRQELVSCMIGPPSADWCREERDRKCLPKCDQ